MYDTSCVLVTTSVESDSIGVEKEPIMQQVKCPIIKIEDIYENEFYKANEQGFKPSLRLRISILNYNGESEVVYNGITYSVIRTQPQGDEIILVCERKVKRV